MLNTSSIHSDTDINKIIELKGEVLQPGIDISKLLRGQTHEKPESDKINELFIKQISRFLRVLYFILLKLQEFQIVQKIKDPSTYPQKLKLLRFTLYHITMQLTSFDDINNYNNTMKVGIELLTKIISEWNAEKDSVLLFKTFEILKNYYRSDLMHRKSRKSIINLRNTINAISMPEHISQAMLDVLEKNCVGTLDNVDATKRFKFLQREQEFSDYLSNVQMVMDKFSYNNKNGLKSYAETAYKEVKQVKLRFLQICKGLHRNIGLSFDYSYQFKKGESWRRVSNIFNLTNRMLSHVESPRVRHDFVQHSSHEIEIDDDEDIRQSDILPRELSDKKDNSINK